MTSELSILLQPANQPSPPLSELGWLRSIRAKHAFFPIALHRLSASLSRRQTLALLQMRDRHVEIRLIDWSNLPPDVARVHVYVACPTVERLCDQLARMKAIFARAAIDARKDVNHNMLMQSILRLAAAA